MTENEVTVMLAEAIDQDKEYKSWHVSTKHLMTFAKLVAAKEREACADLRNMLHGFDGKGRQEIVDAMNRGLDEYQALIKARGQA
jgi:DNA-directed RNA polymerase subunit F